jgi:hypothetical protein
MKKQPMWALPHIRPTTGQSTRFNCSSRKNREAPIPQSRYHNDNGLFFCAKGALKGRILLKLTNRILSFFLAVMMVISLALPASAQDDNPASLGHSATEGDDSFFLNCTPEQAAELIAFYEFVTRQITRPRLLRAASGATGSVSWASLPAYRQQVHHR